MRIDLRVLKRQARRTIRNASPNACFMTLVYLLLTSGTSLIVSLAAVDPLGEIVSLCLEGLDATRAIVLALAATGAMGLFLNILVLIFGIVMDFSYANWCLGTARGGIGELSDLMSGFSMAGRIILLRLVTVLYCFMWYVVIFMPALAAVLMTMIAPSGNMIAILVFLAAAVLWGSRVLRYAMARYCLMDQPDKGVFHALHTSWRMMAGRCGEYFWLRLSFIGWHLLGVLIVAFVEGMLVFLMGGPGALFGMDPTAAQQIPNSVFGLIVLTIAQWPLSVWLTPYVTVSECGFYDLLRSRPKTDQAA